VILLHRAGLRSRQPSPAVLERRGLRARLASGGSPLTQRVGGARRPPSTIPAMAPRLAALARDGKIEGAFTLCRRAARERRLVNAAARQCPGCRRRPSLVRSLRRCPTPSHLREFLDVQLLSRLGPRFLRASGAAEPLGVPRARHRRSSRAHTGRRRDLRSTGWVMGLRNAENLAPALALAVMPSADGLLPTGSAEATGEQHETGLSEGRKGSGPGSFGCHPGSWRS
jgi:hypothetical protein